MDFESLTRVTLGHIWSHFSKTVFMARGAILLVIIFPQRSYSKTLADLEPLHPKRSQFGQLLTTILDTVNVHIQIGYHLVNSQVVLKFGPQFLIDVFFFFWSSVGQWHLVAQLSLLDIVAFPYLLFLQR